MHLRHSISSFNRVIGHEDYAQLQKHCDVGSVISSREFDPFWGRLKGRSIAHGAFPLCDIHYLCLKR